MRIGLIAMSGVRIQTPALRELGVTLPGFVRRGEVIASLPSLGLLTVAGCTPARHDVEYIEFPDLSSVDSLPDFDLVGISSFTAMIHEAYAVAEAYRAKGTPVVMGGLHVSACPEEALAHCDAVVTGGAEGTWPRLLEDFEAGRMMRLYAGLRREVFSPANYIFPRFDLMQGRAYNRVTVQTSRGCPRACEFCAASLRITDRYNQKPVEKVIAEIRAARKTIDEPFFEFADDNTFVNAAWSRDFLRALRREEIRWFTETDASVADDPVLCDLLAESGCRQVLIGFESPRPGDLAGMDPADWKRARAPRIARVVEALQSRGVSVNGCFVLGLDNQTPEIFSEILETVRATGLAEVQYTVLTPFPGTPLYARLRAEGRLLQDEFWDRCTLFDVNYHPKGMTVEELEEGIRWLFRETYTSNETRARIRRFIEHRKAGSALRAVS